MVDFEVSMVSNLKTDDKDIFKAQFSVKIVHIPYTSNTHLSKLYYRIIHPALRSTHKGSSHKVAL